MSNMYDWVDDTRNFIGGQCPHACKYCHVKDSPWPNVRKKYTGKIRLFENEFKKPLKSKSGKPIFIGSCFDMWAKPILSNDILTVLFHLRKLDDNQYVFQTKNTERFDELGSMLHKSDILGTTIETDDFKYLDTISKAIHPFRRITHLSTFKDNEKFVTIEPIINFDLKHMVLLVERAEPTWVNIGADSKNHGLPEPSWEKVESLIAELKKFTTVKCKPNLNRLRENQ